jgi:hypothetical protein
MGWGRIAFCSPTHGDLCTLNVDAHRFFGISRYVWSPHDDDDDEQAFLAASLKTDAELLKWFRERLIWNEPETVVDLLKQGLFVRLYEPQVRAFNDCK